MRGSPAFIAYQDKYGVANASRLDELVLQKREEQKFNSLVEKQLRIEQTKFAAVSAVVASLLTCARPAHCLPTRWVPHLGIHEYKGAGRGGLLRWQGLGAQKARAAWRLLWLR